MLPKGFLGPVSSETGRSPECATRSEGLRKRVSGRSLRRQPHVGAGSLEREANGGRRLGRPVVGRLGQTGRLDLARPGAAAVACPGIALRARVPPRVVRARRLQAASAERIAGGALARGGLRVPFGRWITACGAPGGAPRSHDGPCWVRAVGRRSDTAPQARAWFTNPGWEKFPIPSGENFTAGEEGRTPLAPGLEGDLQDSPQADARPLEPDRGALYSGTRWPGWTPRIYGSFPLSGERGEKPQASKGPGVCDARSASDDALPVRARARRPPRPSIHPGRGEFAFPSGGNFTGGRGEPAPDLLGSRHSENFLAAAVPRPTAAPSSRPPKGAR